MRKPKKSSSFAIAHLKVKKMKNRREENGFRIASDRIGELEDNEIFVFGSNIHGMHGGGAAWFAMQRFGAILGQGEGLQGRSYALPTMEGFASMKAAVGRFIDYARVHQEYIFLVTAIGCGIAGYSEDEVAPLFKDALSLKNVYLPEVFCKNASLNDK